MVKSRPLGSHVRNQEPLLSYCFVKGTLYWLLHSNNHREEANGGNQNIMYRKALYENARPYRNLGVIEATLQILDAQSEWNLWEWVLSENWLEEFLQNRKNL